MIHTQFLTVSPSNPDREVIQSASKVLKSGGLVAFPTETVYGLGADASNENAVRKVFEVKGRPSNNPMIVHVSAIEQLRVLAKEIPPKAKLLATTYWPGPLTLVLQATDVVSRIITAGLETVAVRIPNHPVALALLDELGRGVVAPSANMSGRPSPTTGRHVAQDLDGKIDFILEAGPTVIGVESTVVDGTVDPPAILRQGGLTRESIEETIGGVLANPEHLLQRSPGTRHRHYAPTARVILIGEGDNNEFVERMEKLRKRGKTVGSIVHSEVMKSHHHQIMLKSEPELYAKEIFSAMRTLDEMRVDVILIEGTSERGIGAAIMERLRKAAEQ